MRNKFSFFPLLFIFIAGSLLLASTVQSASIKERMASRIPTINTLKDQGVIGENNKGFLEFRKNSTSHQQLVADENKDRGTVYKAIAKQQGASPKVVGQRRAKMIVEAGKTGHLFQKNDGSWYEK